jgi:L-fuconolactonase
MLTIDSQVHSYEKDSPSNRWVGYLPGPEEATGDQMVVAMDEVGVDAALLVSAYSVYGYDPAYALKVYAQHPSRFRLIKPFNPKSDSSYEEVIEWSKKDGVIGARIMLDNDPLTSDGIGLNGILKAGAEANIPINLHCSNALPLFKELAIKHPNTQLVIDHVGITQPKKLPKPENPFANLDAVLDLAQFENVAIKISGSCTLSKEDFPYLDIWPYLHKIFDAFGLERCLWGTDWTRTSPLLTYREGVDSFKLTDQLTDSEKALLMGKNLMKIYNWKYSK